MQAVLTRPCRPPTTRTRQNKFKVFSVASNAKQQQQPGKQSVQASNIALGNTAGMLICKCKVPICLQIKRVVEISGRTTRQYGAADSHNGSSSTNHSSNSGQTGVGDFQQNAVDLLKGKTILQHLLSNSGCWNQLSLIKVYATSCTHWHSQC